MDPETLRFTETDEWVGRDGEIAVVGITQYAVEQLSDLLQIELPKVGTKLKAGQPFGEIESVKSVNDLNAPVSGEVVEVNPAVVADASAITSGPYTTGWLLKVRLDDPSEIDRLLDHAGYQAKIAAADH
ncbi:glycine cleavage system H protein [Isosphaera pallida ATCC 43644]|jgi:glycine cleavage system H protein|uniref:Glycine cleavage system H protein n=1 Tax=Isosphaera pallida (strain ATCC 43644 / DSM 9630 / IS1B) TaxID=575540 RepID=E8QZW4_ISOPI|nr:glycine cleavage system protein GcvH [Isosphaera pallida]ADV63255.1 glycine cleavage system H protein [Isosphaera pallida ATCC 43644]